MTRPLRVLNADGRRATRWLDDPYLVEEALDSGGGPTLPGDDDDDVCACVCIGRFMQLFATLFGVSGF